MSRNSEQCAANDIVVLFKRALFDGELDPPQLPKRRSPDQPGEWPHMEIDIPERTLPLRQAKLNPRPEL